MAVQVQVKGPKNGVDFSLLGHDARTERIHLDKEVLFVTDIDNATLYMVPLSNVRLILPIDNAQQEIPRSFGRNAGLKVHMIGDSEGDFEQVCNRIEYTKKFDTMMAELMDIKLVEGKEPDVNLLLALPFNNIRYVDFNFFVETEGGPETTEQTQGEGQPQEGAGNERKTRKNVPKKATSQNKMRPNIKARPRK